MAIVSGFLNEKAIHLGPAQRPVANSAVGLVTASYVRLTAPHSSGR